MIEKHEVGNRIRHVRESLNLNQKDFAEKLEMSAPMLSEIENGKKKPGIDFIVKLAKKFDVNLYYILFGEGEMVTDPITSYLKSTDDYGVNIKDIREFLYYFRRSRMVQFSVMHCFTQLMLGSKELVKKEIEEGQKHEENSDE